MAGIEAAGGEAAAIRADLTDPADLQSLITLPVERFGRLDVLVSNAGISRNRCSAIRAAATPSPSSRPPA
ncbi:SDR family NAD(P)-dependent oxidoreductase [Nocardia terpenica]|uniref:SDR family NAD(P)-dependent oxidoreductase n=1 Tax=Nocardia terpenica TaxID=455432 RepID=UPI001EECE9B6|nr:SDR family NAD(P)-dependent oxidoreductase [Nocardia terpenica]